MARVRGRWIGTDYKQATFRQVPDALPHQVPQATPDAITHDRRSDGPADHESHPAWTRLTLAEHQVSAQQRTPGAASPPHYQRELLPAPHPYYCREHLHHPPLRSPQNQPGAAPQALSWPRPLRRRALTIARPARVRIRRRKPWVRARRRRLG
jgi:hypothetical protein